MIGDDDKIWGPWIEEDVPETGDFIQLKVAPDLEPDTPFTIHSGYAICPAKGCSCGLCIDMRPSIDLNQYYWLMWRKRIEPIAKTRDRLAEMDQPSGKELTNA